MRSKLREDEDQVLLSSRLAVVQKSQLLGML